MYYPHVPLIERGKVKGGLEKGQKEGRRKERAIKLILSIVDEII